MDSYSESYQNGGSRREADLQGLSQNIGTNIQKILQNGNIKYNYTYVFFQFLRILMMMTSQSFSFTVSSMQRMIAQIGTPQDNQQLQNQLYEF